MLLLTVTVVFVVAATVAVVVDVASYHALSFCYDAIIKNLKVSSYDCYDFGDSL